MKPRSVQLGIQTGRSARKPGSAPDVGKLARMRGAGSHATRRDSRRDRGQRGSHRDPRHQSRHLNSIGLTIAIGLISLAAVMVAVALWVRPLMQRKKDTTERDRVAADAQVRLVSKFKSPSEGETLALVKKALALRNPSDVNGLVRTGTMTAQQVVDYLSAMKTVDGEISNYTWLGSIDKNNLTLEGVQVIFAAKDKPKDRLAFITPDENGAWRLDFDAFARSVVPSWVDLLASKAESAVVRVYVAKDNYFNGPFADDQKWAAYSLASPDIDEVLVGYCKVGSAQHRAMDMMWSQDGLSFARATLEIRRVEGADQRQFEIFRVLAEDWVLAEKALDEVFERR